MSLCPRHLALSLLIVLALFLTAAEADARSRRFPNIVMLTVDTLRYDRLSIHGYDKPTSPHLDALLRNGVRFEQARVVEPLTAPSMASVFTSLHPHEHGATRNGLSMRPDLPSLPKILQRRGYRTAAFVGNWTLRGQLSGLAEHFGVYQEIFSRKRWFGLMFSEATAEDLNASALDWLRENRRREPDWPFLIWVHYVEPHAPYRFQESVAGRLGVAQRDAEASDRYDTEVAFVDRAIGDLLAEVRKLSPPEDTLVVFASDHGESLGEHDYWGHGRHLYDVTLRVPMGLSWPGRLAPATIEATASNLDLTPTLFGLLGLPTPDVFQGYDWSGVLLRDEAPPTARATYHQAHKGAVQRRNNRQARRQGLLAIARVASGQKQILRTRSGDLKVFDLVRDAGELAPPPASASASPQLLDWLEKVRQGLQASDELPPAVVDEESLEQLRALGYID